MYTLIYKLYIVLKRREKKAKENRRVFSDVETKLLAYIEWFYNVLVRKWYTKFPSHKFGINKKKRKQKIIVSFTSYPKRIGTLWLVVETLLRQSLKPDAVILWLAESQFDGLQSLPDELLRLQKRGLTIRFCKDLRSHKKYFYVMQEYPNDIVILVDDDMFYPYDMVEKLMKMHKKYPADICTMTGEVMSPSFTSIPSGWRNPLLCEQFEHSSEIQVFTGSGSLYPPGVIHSEAFREDLVQRLCPYADDLWLTFMAHYKGTKFTAAYPWRAFPIVIYGTSEGSLWYINAADGKNDRQWMDLLEYYKIEH